MATQTVDFSSITEVIRDDGGIITNLTELIVDTTTVWTLAHVGSLWQQLGFEINGAVTKELSGYRVAINSDGTVIAIADPYQTINGSALEFDDGKIRVFSYNGTLWTETATLTPNYDYNFSGGMGRGMAMSSDGLTILASTDEAGQYGWAHRWSKSGGTWSITGRIWFTYNSGIGNFVGISGDGTTYIIGSEAGGVSTLLASAVKNDSSYTNSNHDNQITPIDTSCDTAAINNDGSVIVAGESTATRNGFSNAGEVRVWDSTTQKGQVLQGTALDEYLGKVVAISSNGDRIAISSGSVVKVYDYTGGIWVQAGGDLAHTTANAGIVTSVSMTPDGLRVAVGVDITSAAESDVVAVFEWGGSSWLQLGFGDITGEDAGDGFGYSVAISADGTTVVSGAPFNDDNGTDAGSTRVYKFQ